MYQRSAWLAHRWGQPAVQVYNAKRLWVWCEADFENSFWAKCKCTCSRLGQLRSEGGLKRPFNGLDLPGLEGHLG